MSDCVGVIDFFPFQSIRSEQKKALEEIQKAINEGYKNIIIEAPPGTGKSPLAMAIARYFGDAYICTNQKTLQKQYMRDFKLFATEIRGRPNHICKYCEEKKLNTDKVTYTCADGRCTVSEIEDDEIDLKKLSMLGLPECNRKPTVNEEEGEDFAANSASRGPLYWRCSENDRCNYYMEKMKALNSDITIQNYSYFLIESNFVGDFGPREVLISDEGHNIEDKILEFINVSITKKQMSYMSKERLLTAFDPKAPQSEILPAWIMWAEDLNLKLPGYLEEIDVEMKRIEKLGPYDQNHENKEKMLLELTNRKLQLQRLHKKMDFFLKDYHEDPHNWIVQPHFDSGKKIYKVSFKPLKIAKYAQSCYFNMGKTNVIMSATILNWEKFATDLGLNINETKFVKISSVFRSENKKIYHLKIGYLGYNSLRSNSKLKIIDAVDLILSLFPNDKGIIHTTNNNLSKYIKWNSCHTKRILTHTGQDREIVLKNHIGSKEPTVLCTPSMTEGVDLKGNLSRFQILIKVPYGNISDIRIKERKKIDQIYYDWKACISVCQALGRSIRDEEDWAITFTLDSRFEDFCNRNFEMLNEGFIQFERPLSEFVEQFKDQIPSLMKRNRAGPIESIVQEMDKLNCMNENVHKFASKVTWHE